MATIQFRRNTTSGWTSSNPFLANGEPGFERNDNKLKIGDGSTAWNDLDYIGGTGGSAAVYAGSATLASGSATVSASWVTANTVIVVTPQAAAGVGVTGDLYVDPVNIVAATSFDISSDDITDSRTVFWMATEPPAPTLPDTFYISFRAQFAADEVADTFANNGAMSLIQINRGTTDFDAVDDYGLQILTGGGDASNYGYLYHWIDVSPDFPFTSYTGPGDFALIDADAWHVFDLKIERTPTTADITLRVDTVEVGTLHADLDAPWVINNFALGNLLPGVPQQIDHKFDWFRIGSLAYGDSDLFAAEFATDEAPFTSIEVTAPDTVTFAGDAAVFSNAGGAWVSSCLRYEL